LKPLGQPRRGQERERRDDGLVSLRCPYCRWTWYRLVPARIDILHEIKCHSCKRIVLYRVNGDIVEDVTATILPESEAQPGRGSHSANGDSHGKVLRP